MCECTATRPCAAHFAALQAKYRHLSATVASPVDYPFIDPRGLWQRLAEDELLAAYRSLAQAKGESQS